MTSVKYLPLVALCLALAACGSGGGTTGSTTDTSTDSGTDTGGSSGGDTGGDTGSGGGTSTVTIDAGLDQVVPAGGSAALSASIDDTSVTVTWEQLTGPIVSLSSATSLTPSFTVPSVSSSTEMTFMITAEDGTDAPPTDTVSVEVWVPFDQSDATTLGDFSDNSGWQCDVDTGIASSYTEDAQGSRIAISANGIPDNAVGTFPNGGNPHSIEEQRYNFEIPYSPQKGTTATEVKIFGVTVDGIRFDRQTAECYNNEDACTWRYEAITPGVASNAGRTSWAGGGGASAWLGTDCNNAHVQPGGIYHYHGLPESLINRIGDEGNQMTLVGHAADGFPVYARWGYADPTDKNSGLVRIQASYELKEGTRPSGPGGEYSGIFVQDWQYVEGSGDLDECSGRFGVTPEYPDGIYHYYLTDDYPYIPKCVFGNVVDSRFNGAG